MNIIGHNKSVRTHTFDMASFGSKVTYGSQGSSRSFSPKIYFSFHDMVKGLIFYQLDLLIKVMGPKIHPALFGVKGVKNSFSLKILYLVHVT